MILVDGYTLIHEHITIDLSSIKNDPDAFLNEQQKTINELKKLYHYGVRNIIDVTNIGMGRNCEYVDEVAKCTHINIIHSTGYYKDPFLPIRFGEKSIDEIAQVMIDEINTGIDNRFFPQVIGEIGTSKDEMSENERKLFLAAIKAHKVTGKVISTHTTLGTHAFEQIKLFQENHVDLAKVIIGHVDLCKDLNKIISLLETGVNVAFDTVGKHAYCSDEMRIDFLLEIEKRGFIDQIVLSEDLTRKSHLEENKGIGYSYMFEVFVPMMKTAGIKKGSIEQMLRFTPQRIFGDIK